MQSRFTHSRAHAAHTDIVRIASSSVNYTQFDTPLDYADAIWNEQRNHVLNHRKYNKYPSVRYQQRSATKAAQTGELFCVYINMCVEEEQSESVVVVVGMTKLR